MHVAFLVSDGCGAATGTVALREMIHEKELHGDGRGNRHRYCPKNMIK